MIQRIQSIFLLLAALAFLSLFKFPFAVSDMANSGYLADKDFDIYDNPALLLLAGLGALIALVAIFLYKNRPLQIRLSYLTIIMGVLILIVASVLFYNEATAIYEKAKIDDRIGLYLPILGFVFGFIAARFIRKDEKLVRSMDRLR
jgi:peptidoglycan/LPS O-acetylase OafA/YrhL